MEEEAARAAEQAAEAAGHADALAVEPTLFVSLADSMSPAAYALAYIMVALFLIHGIVLGVFLLNTMVDATLTTASERARNLWRTLGGILAMQVVIAALFVVILLLNRNAV